jgi:integrase
MGTKKTAGVLATQFEARCPPVTVLDYTLPALVLRLAVLQGVIKSTPFSLIPKPQVGKKRKRRCLQQSSRCWRRRPSPAPARNKAILALLLDTGCRASELVALRRKDLDLLNGRCRVLGKGDKYRTLFSGIAPMPHIDYLSEENMRAIDSKSSVFE